ncbi:hypothetical protein Q1695_012774 [Nippostrongylus brasiliensis]|nr:hypothetical protein Q1695_012774 [Nippostrongylus brasiliensis]
MRKFLLIVAIFALMMVTTQAYRNSYGGYRRARMRRYFGYRREGDKKPSKKPNACCSKQPDADVQKGLGIVGIIFGSLGKAFNDAAHLAKKKSD